MAKLFRGDKVIWVVFLLLSIISLVEVYSSIGLYAYSFFSAKSPTSLFLRHLVIVIATYAAIVLISRVNYRAFSRFALLGYWVALVLLVVALAFGRWIKIPIIGQFQPSEIAKIVLIVFVARMLALKKDHVGEIGTFLQLMIYTVLVVALVFPTNFSTAALIFLACYLMMLLGGVNRKYWWRLLLVGLVAVVAFLAISYYRYERSMTTGQTQEQVFERQDTWGHRVYSWINPEPDELTQENMARMAIARGGVLGVGIGNTVHARLMTQAHNDFIYAVIIEEMGMVGGIIVFLLYSILYFRCIRLAWRCKGRFGALTVAGMGTVIYLQALVNMSVAVGVLPVTGQTLPFISYGGTAYLFMGCGLGIIQSVAADVYAKEKETGENADKTPTSDGLTPELSRSDAGEEPELSSEDRVKY
ncbi:MAG: FtsW/RodA/SpoVE family cell cycle protein [Bacteroidales bacterium]|nr:FtsW/RodA/SpoVE family cell cycle protein [Bacteroidales bacterium]